MPVRKAPAVLLIAAAFGVGTDTHAADHLTPCTDVLNEYYVQVQTLMRRAARGNAVWKVTVFPSFHPEWSIRATRIGDDYELTVIRLDRSFWDAGWVTSRRNEMRRDPSIARARARATTRKISARLFSELEAALRRSLEAARANENALDEIVLDGVKFRFEFAESSCGETYDLDPNTKTGRLVRIILALCNPSGEDEILRMLDELRR